MSDKLKSSLNHLGIALPCQRQDELQATASLSIAFVGRVMHTWSWTSGVIAFAFLPSLNQVQETYCCMCRLSAALSVLADRRHQQLPHRRRFWCYSPHFHCTSVNIFTSCWRCTFVFAWLWYHLCAGMRIFSRYIRAISQQAACMQTFLLQCHV